MEELLHKFIADAESHIFYNQWLETDKFRVYVRKSQRFLVDKIIPTLDIANIHVEESYRGQGLFTNFVHVAHESHPWAATYIESILEDRLIGWCKIYGWVVAHTIPPSYYKLKEENTYISRKGKL